MIKKAKNYAEIFWPEYCRKNRAFLTEKQIVVDLVTKIRGSRSSLTWWTLIERIDLVTYNQRNKNIVARYYSIGSPYNPYFKIDRNIKVEDIQLRIFEQVWDYLNREIYDAKPKSISPRSNKRNVGERQRTRRC